MSFDHVDLPSNSLLVCEVGSTLHGIGIGSDDTDYMGIVVEPWTAVYGLDSFEQIEYRTAAEGERSGPGDVDVVHYGLKKWMRLAVKGNPSVILPLYAPETFLAWSTPLGDELREMRAMVVSQKCRGRFLGYLNGQRKRAEQDRGSGRGRREGREAKWASHMVRLGFQAEELLTTGELTLPMPEEQAEICRAIKREEIRFDHALALSEDLEGRVEAIEDSPLREEPDMEWIQRWMRGVYARTYENAP